MKLLASLIVRNELSRYLKPCIDHLMEFCDEVAVMDDGSNDGSVGWLQSRLGKKNVYARTSSLFYEHEGRSRQSLLDFTLGFQPTHVIAIDADEFVSDGATLRDSLSDAHEVWRFPLQEVWRANEKNLDVRDDGGWGIGSATVWQVPKESRNLWIQDSKLACGRDPMFVRKSRSFPVNGNVSLLHFGWANQQQRDARYNRYVEHDSGNFHNKRHLDSIMWEDSRCRLITRTWPDGLTGVKDRILRSVNNT